MKIRVEVPTKLCEIHDVLTSCTPQEVISGLQDILQTCKELGYDELTIAWEGYDDPTATLYGAREETDKEREVREKREEVIRVRKEKAKQKAIEDAKKVLKKYGERV